jgi:hypothetical protein
LHAENQRNYPTAFFEYQTIQSYGTNIKAFKVESYFSIAESDFSENNLILKTFSGERICCRSEEANFNSMDEKKGFNFLKIKNKV